MAIENFGLDPDGKLGLSEDDVISVEGGWFGLEAKMTTLKEMMGYLASWGSKGFRDTNNWFTRKGYPCKILRTKGGGWQTGRIRICLEFVPDNPEAFIESPPKSESSPLDDLRSNLDI